jgi:sortase A
VLGRILLGIGVLILLFVAYQLWGTGLAESHSQAVLRQRFDALLHHAPAASGTTTTRPSPATTSSAPETSTTTAGDQPTVGATTAAPGDGAPVGVLSIPKIGVDRVVIVQGTSTSDLQQGPGHYPGTPLPGEMGNAAIAGHRTTYGAPFYNLDQLHEGDAIKVTTVQGSFTYDVSTTQIVDPSDVSVVADTTTPELTLTTCNPRFSASQRLVVHAMLSNATPPAPTESPPPTPQAASRSASQARGLAGGQGAWLPALGLGVLSAAVVGAMFVLARRRRRGGRLAVYTVGGAASLVALFFFFGAVSPLLPASF